MHFHYTHYHPLYPSNLPTKPISCPSTMSSFIHCTLSLYTTPSSYPLLGALPIHSLHLSTAMHGHALVMLFSTHLGSHASFITPTSLHPYLTPHACHSTSPHTHLLMSFIPRTMQGRYSHPPCPSTYPSCISIALIHTSISSWTSPNPFPLTIRCTFPPCMSPPFSLYTTLLTHSLSSAPQVHYPHLCMAAHGHAWPHYILHVMHEILCTRPPQSPLMLA